MTKLILIPLLIVTTSVLADHPTVAFGNEASGPIITIAAPTMQKGAWGAGIRTEVIDEDHSEHNHAHHNDSTKIKWDAIIELNGETRRKNKIGGLSEQHSGGTALFISSGLSVL